MKTEKYGHKIKEVIPIKIMSINDLLKEYVADIKTKPYVRRIVAETMEESLGKPIIYIQQKFLWTCIKRFGPFLR